MQRISDFHSDVDFGVTTHLVGAAQVRRLVAPVHVGPKLHGAHVCRDRAEVLVAPWPRDAARVIT